MSNLAKTLRRYADIHDIGGESELQTEALPIREAADKIEEMENILQMALRHWWSTLPTKEKNQEPGWVLAAQKAILPTKR